MLYKPTNVKDPILKKTTLLNIEETQQHPFHVLQNIRLPFLVALLSGLIALVFITKLHNLRGPELFTYSSYIYWILDSFFSVNEFRVFSVNLRLSFYISLLILTI